MERRADSGEVGWPSVLGSGTEGTGRLFTTSCESSGLTRSGEPSTTPEIRRCGKTSVALFQQAS